LDKKSRKSGSQNPPREDLLNEEFDSVAGDISDNINFEQVSYACHRTLLLTRARILYVIAFLVHIPDFRLFFDSQVDVERGLLRFGWKPDPKSRTASIIILVSFPINYPSSLPTFLVTSGGTDIDKHKLMKVRNMGSGFQDVYITLFFL